MSTFSKILDAIRPEPTVLDNVSKMLLGTVLLGAAGTAVAAIVHRIKRPRVIDKQAEAAGILLEETDAINRLQREREFKTLVVGITNNDPESLRAYAKVLEKRARAANPPDTDNVMALSAVRGLVDALEASGALKGVKVRVSDDGRVRFDKTATS